MKYETLAKNVELAISEYEHYNGVSVEGYSFHDLISWLYAFGHLESVTDDDVE